VSVVTRIRREYLLQFINISLVWEQNETQTEISVIYAWHKLAINVLICAARPSKPVDDVTSDQVSSENCYLKSDKGVAC
jgi:hypothetical protein